MRDNWRPMPCRHGAWPSIEQEFIDSGFTGMLVERIPGPKYLLYDCPTPRECCIEAYSMEHVSTPGHQMRVGIWENGFQPSTQAHFVAWNLIPHLVLRPSTVDTVLAETLQRLINVK